MRGDRIAEFTLSGAIEKMNVHATTDSNTTKSPDLESIEKLITVYLAAQTGSMSSLQTPIADARKICYSLLQETPILMEGYHEFSALASARLDHTNALHYSQCRFLRAD